MNVICPCKPFFEPYSFRLIFIRLSVIEHQGVDLVCVHEVDIHISVIILLCCTGKRKPFLNTLHTRDFFGSANILVGKACTGYPYVAQVVFLVVVVHGCGSAGAFRIKSAENQHSKQ